MTDSAIAFILNENLSLKDELKILAKANWLNLWETVEQLDRNLFRREAFQNGLSKLKNYEKFALQAGMN